MLISAVLWVFGPVVDTQLMAAKVGDERSVILSSGAIIGFE